MGESVTVKITVTNSGDRAGDEVVQCYLRDDYSSVTRSVKELKDFRRISLQPGESREVLFTITPDMMAFYDRSMKRVIEPGSFTVLVGSSSRNEDLQRVTYVVKK
ncbi:MAG: fibronectin type III-like domain-contianing protein [Bacteroides sp.]|nr:fibronectin type III-like domain-contianing protein [Bacteroides sp.]